MPSNGFEAQSSLRVHFGIGEYKATDTTTVVWPDGQRQELGPLPCCKYYQIFRDQQTDATPPPPPHRAPAVPAKVSFREGAARAGVVARHHPPIFDAKLNHIMAMVSAGAAGGAIGEVHDNGRDDIFISDSRAGYPNHLFINKGDGTFEDRAAEAGVANYNDEYNVSAGGLFFDYDGDGLEDLLIYRFGSQVLLRNRGDGTFEDVSLKSGLAAIKGNFLSAIAFDADNDGCVDLYLAAYFPDVDLFHLKDDHVLHDSWENARNGGRKVFLKNNCNGTFTDRTREYGLEDSGWTMAVGYGDIDNSGWQSVYLANDYGPDTLFHNEHGHFKNVTTGAIGFDTKKGMNAEFGDIDNKGLPDIFVTNVTEGFLHECNMLWHNNGDLTFTDISSEMGVCDGGWGWGGKFADVDNAGWLDLYQVNGFFTGPKTDDYLTVLLPALWNDGGEDPSSASKWPPVNGMSMVNKERHRLWMNQRGMGFVLNDDTALSSDLDGRAVLTTDLMNDGRVDFVVTNNDGPVQVFFNETQSGNNWVEFRLKGNPPNTDAAGAKVTIETEDGRQYRELSIGNGFGGASSHRIHFGLGRAPKLDMVSIRWPDGNVQQIDPPAVNQVVTIREQNGSSTHAAR
jgi:hypothetical protein